ncbi:putative toxin-antitoxin system toxin component, PIN family [Thiorhodovibrio frisius]|uniref:Putative toxin-antitoxin system toxin component, PIN family n=2 Tax=Thiorhodovibrio frisius TaxID=631362 RepID=H8YXP7_9GAMM|nr:putative toxin-antitoxin system toxin component, PIN family [Thiorhodovibrio frisius]EIC23223.1 putative toxin-antitoxin system toxin component, PIN family [Thiorhodovibrio frisius]WPL23700.1 putative toxin-antitoxin system toxin component, PIN family [Thiorhodovibrio frisius]
MRCISHMLWHMIVVLDTDVVVSAVVSPTGASRFLLHEIGVGRLPAAASVPLLLEYEAVLKRPETLDRAGGTPGDMDVILDQLAAVMQRVPIWYLWRPLLRDANDDMVLEAAANAAATHLVTFNVRDFGIAPSRFGIELCRPAEIARILRNE